MANMGYCRFQNTRGDVADCISAIKEEKSLSAEEANAARLMFTKIADFMLDYGIIDDFYPAQIDNMVEGLEDSDCDED